MFWGTFGPWRVYQLLLVDNGMPIPLGIPCIHPCGSLAQSWSEWISYLDYLLSKCAKHLRGPKVPQGSKSETKAIFPRNTEWIWITIVKLYVYCFEFGVQKYPTSTFTGLFFCLLSTWCFRILRVIRHSPCYLVGLSMAEVPIAGHSKCALKMCTPILPPFI